MSFSTLTIATRKSPLALKQTESVKKKLLSLCPDKSIDLLPLTTTGDAFLETRLNKIGGKGLFTKELEAAMLRNEADIAVHSMKDMPNDLPKGLSIAAILKREDPRDAFISQKYDAFDALPKGAVIGTSSLRRECQIKAIRPDLIVQPLRGNINTRLKKATNNEFDAIILAAAGLKRMGMSSYIKEIFDTTQILPAAGQGALGIEAVTSQAELIEWLGQLICQQTTACVIAERTVIKRLNGSCQVPIAAYCEFQQDGQLHLKAIVGNQSGTTLIHADAMAPLSDAEPLGNIVAKSLLEKGAGDLLDTYAHD